MRAAIFYATREGQTQRIADHLALTLAAHGVEADVHDVRIQRRVFDWPLYDIVIVAASVHMGRHEPEMVRFVLDHRRALEERKAAFLSVTLSQAGAEDPARPAAERARAMEDAESVIKAFVGETDWQPAYVLPVAGRLAYRSYNPLIRFVMTRIARKEHASTDTSHDHEFTDWTALDRFTTGLVNARRMEEVPA